MMREKKRSQFLPERLRIYFEQRANKREEEQALEVAQNTVGSFTYNCGFYEDIPQSMLIAHPDVKAFVENLNIEKIKNSIFLIMEKGCKEFEFFEAIRMITEDRMGLFHNEEEFKKSLVVYERDGSVTLDVR